MSDKLMTRADLAEFFSVTVRQVDKIRTLDGFPKPVACQFIRYPRYFESEVIEWAKSLQPA